MQRSWPPLPSPVSRSDRLRRHGQKLERGRPAPQTTAQTVRDKLKRRVPTTLWKTLHWRSRRRRPRAEPRACPHL
uniref:Uncharacterized protein n=1 Tax=Anguilla anguilla TaxID=7936 RepID=A0A0E9WQ10_ANGAN